MSRISTCSKASGLSALQVGIYLQETTEPILEAKPKEDYPPVSFLELYKYASHMDKFFIVLGSIICTLGAVANSLLSITFGDATNVIVTYVSTLNETNATLIQQAEEELENGLIAFVIFGCSLGALIMVATYIATVLFNYSALKQTYRIRDLFLHKVLNQDVGWYDVHQTGDFASRIADDLKKLEEGIGEKVSIFLYYEVIFVTSIIQGLILGWELALICMVSLPVTTISMGFISWISSKLAKQEMDAYGEAGAIAEETLSSIRTVVAFGGQKKEEERYDELLSFACKNNIKRLFFNGISNAVMWFFAYGSYSLGFWYGVKLIIRERSLPIEDVVYDAGNMVAIFFSVLTGTWFFGMASPFIETFGIAKGAAAKIFGVIASEPSINASKGNGMKFKKMEGKITFRSVHFTYPSRPDLKILQGIELTINPGETVALVGSSGCGKSTCIQLIQRYYDPSSGNVFIDDHNVADLDLAWMRSHIGVVGQEPVLFEMTIAENIKLGADDASEDDIKRAATKANAHSFISLLPQGYNTLVGERGAQLSGGQKQRIAIARALVREPSILLLDEATSALDTNSEAVVQAALDAASNECTTVIVAHRLSTVRKADRIVVIGTGKVVEQGTHDELMHKEGAYFELVTAQISQSDTDEDAFTKTETEEKIGIVRQTSLDGANMRSNSIISNVKEILEESKSGSSTSSLWAIMKYNSPEWWVILLGCVGSIVTGAGMPVYAIVFGDVMGVLASHDDDYIISETKKFAIFFLIIGIVTGIATLVHTYMFGIAGEKLTMRLRSQMFKSFLSQEMGYFDNKEHGVGSLCARLSGEAASVQGATGQRIGTILNSLSTVVIALSTSFYYEWRITFVALCFSPLIVMAFYLEQKIIAKESQGHYKSLQNSTKIAVEGINGIRTLASLGSEQSFHIRYMAEIVPYQRMAQRNTHFRGLVYGLSRSLMFYAYAASLYFGATLIKNEGLEYAKVFIVSESIITSSWSLGNALAFTPNFQKGLIAASRIFELFSRIPLIRDGSQKNNGGWDSGNIAYEKVYFSYPSRPTIPVLRGLNLTIPQGKVVALVGPSGCGKSTIIQQLVRFYDPTSGSVSVDGKHINTMQLSTLRSHLGVVSQEPNLFSRTIAENIAYGDNEREVTREEIIDAAKKANIHTFIASLPLGYETKLGEKGTQLSGGQKQRVAIARALVRNPKVLLLDEATSALDAESEKVVQEALDNAKKGRTCITIAHRLTTIQDADVICVINHGRVAEIGTHAELLGLRGIYYNLHNLQH
ncbi:hypothetical protein PPYR_14467 [Photinus pyralis]|uniref:Uncharacterized protein n=1 Tax=Photinus pyralis TaxID=7054 RepID=A0A5N4A5F5_PHOPY|nr:ATP-dependent translocase ABCB1-like isoform X2 [Photinus pyralis]KAB0792508.1 hypothetical protein PPYR_14467 [Photinus pyralis]